MENKQEILSSNAPRWMKLLPVVLGAGYFSYAKFIKKTDSESASLVSLFLFFAAMLPWFSFEDKKIISAIKSSAGEGATELDKNGRQQAIAYIVEQQERQEKSKRFTDKPVSPEVKNGALQTLTNDELLAVLATFKFLEYKTELAKKYGQISGDEKARQIAKNEFGIDLSGVDNVARIASIAMGKIVKFYNGATTKQSQ